MAPAALPDPTCEPVAAGEGGGWPARLAQTSARARHRGLMRAVRVEMAAARAAGLRRRHAERLARVERPA